jgi:hypothetical protein
VDGWHILFGIVSGIWIEQNRPANSALALSGLELRPKPHVPWRVICDADNQKQPIGPPLLLEIVIEKGTRRSRPQDADTSGRQTAKRPGQGYCPGQISKAYCQDLISSS